MDAETKSAEPATLSSREFNQDVGRAKRAAENGPVIITDRGEPAFVLMRFETYRSLAGRNPRLPELLDLPGMEAVDFDPPRFGQGVFQPPELS